MKRWIALVVIIALAGAAAGYVVDAPFAPHVAASSRQTAALFDSAAAALVAALGRGGAIAAPLVLGALLCAPILLLWPRTPALKALPGPVWRPEPLTADPLSVEQPTGEADMFAPETPLPRPVVLIRKARSRSRDWFGDASWFGGLPKLAGIPWPRGSGGAALPFAAQIDLAEIAAACPETPLPKSGSLAFFVGTGAVVPVPAGAHEFTDPPMGSEGGLSLAAADRAPDDAFYPFWPVEALAVPLPEELRDRHELGNEQAVEQAMTEWLAMRYPLRDGPLTVREPVERVWWHGAIHLAARFHAALDEASRLVDKRTDRTADAREDVELLGADPGTTSLRLEAAQRAFDREDAKLHATCEQQAALAQVTQAMDGFTSERDPWTPLTHDEFAVLQDVLAHVARDCADLVRNRAPATMAELSAFSLRAMVSGPPEALAQVSDAELARINAGYRLANAHQHEVFGPGGCHRAARDDHRGEILLLQLASDDMMGWHWRESGRESGGDTGRASGLYQFWISPPDLARRRWDRVSLTFEPG